MYDDTHLAWDRAWGSSGTGRRHWWLFNHAGTKSPGQGGPIDPESSFATRQKKLSTYMRKKTYQSTGDQPLERAH